MNKSETIAMLAPALVKAQSEMKAAQKTGDNKFDRYKYSKLEDFFDAAKPVLAKHGLAIVLSTPSVTALPERATKAGGAEHACQVQVTATLIHVSGEWIETIGHGEGQDRADKSIYKAITGAKKYAIAGLLAIPTTDDPEADESVGQSAAPAKKMDSQGNSVTKKPSYTDDQKVEAGRLRSDAKEFTNGEARFSALWKQMAYDSPVDFIDAASQLLRDLQEENQPEGTK